MCWTTRNKLTKLIADKNIECYKNFRLEDITFKQKSIFNFKFGKKKIIQLISLFKKYKYIPYKKQQIIDLKSKELFYYPDSFNNHGIIGYKIDAGYHSYDTIKIAQKNIFFGDEVVIKCIIPKGTEYYINNDNEIISSTIIVTDQIVY